MTFGRDLLAYASAILSRWVSTLFGIECGAFVLLLLSPTMRPPD
jgi:hypothetical protein